MHLDARKRQRFQERFVRRAVCDHGVHFVEPGAVDAWVREGTVPWSMCGLPMTDGRYLVDPTGRRDCPACVAARNLATRIVFT